MEAADMQNPQLLSALLAGDDGLPAPNLALLCAVSLLNYCLGNSKYPAPIKMSQPNH
jgi:hypothetical protein